MMKRLFLCIALVSLVGGCAADASVDIDDEEEVGTSSSELRAEVHRVQLENGITISYLEQGARHGEDVVFLHGYTDSHHSWDLNLPQLPRRFHAYAIDQRGHGDSSKPACCYTQNDFARDVVLFMNAVGIRRATLVGHSMGSFIAQQVALDYPSRVRDLVLVGSAPTVAGNPVALELKSIVDTLEDPIDPAFVREFQAGTFFRTIPAEYLDTAVEESLKVPATVWKQALDGLIAEDHTARLDEIRAKTLVFWGDQDVFFGRADQDALTSAIRRSRLLVYPQTGHGLHAEAPQPFVRDLSRFMH